jgi:hypothetical protein
LYVLQASLQPRYWTRKSCKVLSVGITKACATVSHVRHAA